MKLNWFAGRRMPEGQTHCVEPLSGQTETFRERRVSPVQPIPHQRVAFRLEVDTNLVGSARLQNDVDQRRTRKYFAGVVVGDGVFSARGDSELPRRTRVAPDGGVDGAGTGVGVALDERSVVLRHLAVVERLFEGLVTDVAER